MILHITSKQDWSDAQAKGEYTAPSLAIEGFIHLSTDKQAIYVANAFYKGRIDLVLLVVDETRLSPRSNGRLPPDPLQKYFRGGSIPPRLWSRKS